MHLRADHPDRDLFIPLTCNDKVPVGHKAAYKNLKLHLVYGDDLISNFFDDDESIESEFII